MLLSKEEFIRFDKFVFYVAFLVLKEVDLLKKFIRIIMLAECIISTLLYLFAVYTFHNQSVLLMGLISILCLLAGNGIILFFLTNLINFDQNKINGFKFELFILGFVFQILAFVLLKNRIS